MIEQLKSYSKTDCYKLSSELDKLLEHKYISDIDMKKAMVEHCDSINFDQLLKRIAQTDDNSKYLRFNYAQDLSSMIDIDWGDDHSQQDVYDKTGDILSMLIKKVSRCRKLTADERLDIEIYSEWGSDGEPEGNQSTTEFSDLNDINETHVGAVNEIYSLR